MKKVFYYFTTIVCLLVNQLSAQESFEAKVTDIANRIENIKTEEKIGLKYEIEKVNIDLEKGLVSKDEADEKKQTLAVKYAKLIENRVSGILVELNNIVQQKVDEKQITKHNEKNTEKYNDTIIKKLARWNSHNERRTKDGLLLAFGLNNLETNGSINNSDYKYWESYFFEIGPIFSTRIAKNNNLLHLKYGLTFTQTNLCPTENRVFKQDGNQTNLEKYPIQLNVSRFENSFLMIPLNLEFDLTESGEDPSTFKTQESFRFGLGGYVGLRIYSKQKLIYEIEDSTFKQKEIGDFNVNDFIYGLSTYVGYRMTSLYARYDLNPMFYSNPIKQNNVSFGLRFDFL